ncbi:Peptidase, partial [Oryctes borbonicus]
ACLADMFINLLGVQLTEEIYPATAAELNYSISVGDKGIIIKVDGYNEKLPTLLNLILTYFKKVSANLTKDIFEAVKDKLTKVYHNKFLKPFDLAKDIRLSILLNNYWTAVDKHAAMFKLTFDMMKGFSNKLVKSFYILGLIQGNVDKETAIITSKMIADVLKCEPLLPENFPKIQVHELPNGEYCCRTMSFNENDSNSIIVNYYQSDRFTMRNNVILELLMMYIEEPLFDILRTKEQLGYHVY